MLIQILASLLAITTVGAAGYPPYFHNQTGCLYAYIEEGRYYITIPEAENQAGKLTGLAYDDNKTNCTKDTYPGNLVVVFNTADNNMNSMKIHLQIKQRPNEGYWQVTQAFLEITPVNKDLFPQNTIELKPLDIYAGDSFSYSCNQLTLQNLHPKKDGPHFKLTLKRFQLQPFSELPNNVFASSYDCAVWLTLPLISGLILMLFITFTVMIGVYLLIEQGNQTSDLRFSKQGGMLLNQAQLDATKG